MSHQTIKGIRTAAHGLFQWALDRDLVSSNPITRAKAPKVRHGEVGTISASQLKGLLRTALAIAPRSVPALAVYSDGIEELYSMEKDPMEWTNLANHKSPELDQVKTHLRTFLPKDEMDSLPASKEKKSEKTKKEIDPTIKSKRILKDLK